MIADAAAGTWLTYVGPILTALVAAAVGLLWRSIDRRLDKVEDRMIQLPETYLRQKDLNQVLGELRELRSEIAELHSRITRLAETLASLRGGIEAAQSGRIHT